MGKKQKAWAIRRRRLLLEVLGGKCAQENDHCEGKLTVDCIIPQGDRHHKMDTSARLSFYNQQLKQNNLQLLCVYHQELKARQERKATDWLALSEQAENDPF